MQDIPLVSRTPFLRLLIPLITGICIQEFFPEVQTYLFTGMAGIILWAFSIKHASAISQYRQKSLFGIASFLLIATIGILITLANTPQKKVWNTALYPTAIARLDTPVKVSGKSLKVNATVTALCDSNGKMVPQNEKISLIFRNDIESESLIEGNIIIFRQQLSIIRNNSNQYSFDYARYMKRNGILYSQYLKTGDWKRMGYVTPSSLTYSAQIMRDKAIEALRKSGLSKPVLSLLEALILGYTGSLQASTRADFSAAGLSHVLAVSGLHTGIIAYLIYLLLWPLSFFGMRRIQTIATIIILWFYAFFTGLSPSVIRACIMTTFVLTAPVLGRRNCSINALLASAFFMLLYRPSWLFNISFQLSFSAVLSILLLYPYLTRWCENTNGIIRYTGKMVAVSSAAQVGTLPISVFYFHQIPLLFLFTNLLILPVLPVIIGAGIFVLLSVISGFHASWLVHILNISVEFILNFIHYMGQIPYGNIQGVWLEERYLFLYFIFFLFIWLALRTRQIRYLITVMLFAVFFFIWDAHEAYKKQEYPDIAIYDTREATYIRLSSPAKCYILSTDSIINPEKNYELCKEYLMRHRLESCHSINSPMSDANIYYHPPFIGYYGKRIVIADNSQRSYATTNKIPVDYVVINKNFKGKLPDILRLYTPGIIILSLDIYPSQAYRWGELCKKAGIPYYDIRLQGMWIEKIKEK